MDITRYAIAKKMFGGATTDHTVEDAILTGTLTEYTNDRVTYYYSFAYFLALTTVNFPLVTIINGYSFMGCSSLTTANIPSATIIYEGAFEGCSSLTTADYPLVTDVYESAFKNCSSLTTVNFPLVTKINNNTFIGCSSLTTANFPSATIIGGYAFQNCSALTEADFPLVTKIYDLAFQNCSALTALILRSEVLCTKSGSTSFDSLKNTPIASGTGYIYVPSALIDSYKAATNWTTYAAQFRALEDYTVDGTTTGALDESKVNA